MRRNAHIERNTLETKISIKLDLDGTGSSEINTGVGFLDHMLILFSRHGLFDLQVHCDGDLHIDCHHSVEDVGISLGMAFASSLGDMRGIKRYGSFLLPMDESLVMVAIDLSGRPYLHYELPLPSAKLGDFDTETVQEFFYGMSRKMNATIHIKLIHGQNTHHIIEAVFKCFGRALSEAVTIDPRLGNAIPSTKGILV